MEIFNIIGFLKGQIETFKTIDNLIDLGRLYYRLINYNKYIKLYIPDNLYKKYIIKIDAILFESYLGDDKDQNNYIEILLEQLLKILNEIIKYLNKNLLLLFDETDLINNFICQYYKEDYKPVLCIYFEDYLGDYTDNNSLDINASIINNYTSSIDESIELFRLYYDVEFIFTGTKINYCELAAITLYHYLFDKVHKIIDDNYNSAKDTEDED
jgi:hypothetical protein